MTTALQFTGERFHPDLAGEMWAEHWHRYHFVLPLIAGKKVLDVASGEGYGSALMASHAEAVAGVDVSTEAVAHARGIYARLSNLHFTEGSCAKLPFADGSFDVVVSFETIEHIHEQEAFLDEIKRVLTPTGLLIMSSPNRVEYSEARGYVNEFHVRELDRDEFAGLLGSRFAHSQWYGQRNLFVSLITPEQPETRASIGAQALTLSKAAPDRPLPALPAVYFLAIASNDPATLNACQPRLSVFNDQEEWAYNDYRKIYQGSLGSWQREQALVARCAALEEKIALLEARVAAMPPAAGA